MNNAASDAAPIAAVGKRRPIVALRGAAGPGAARDAARAAPASPLLALPVQRHGTILAARKPTAQGGAAAREEGSLADHSAYQKGVIKRYYEHRDTIAVHKLAEILSSLWIEKGKGKVTQLWESAYKELQKAGVPINQACVIVEDRDLEALGKVIAELS